MKNLPKKIYLNFGDISLCEFWGDPKNGIPEISFDECGEVTWSKEDVQGINVPYVNLDRVIDWLNCHIQVDSTPVVYNEDGQPLAESFLANAEARCEAVDEVVEQFKKDFDL